MTKKKGKPKRGKEPQEAATRELDEKGLVKVSNSFKLTPKNSNCPAITKEPTNNEQCNNAVPSEFEGKKLENIAQSSTILKFSTKETHTSPSLKCISMEAGHNKEPDHAIPSVSSSSSSSLSETFKRFELKEKFVARPGLGQAGKVIPLIVNYYKLEIKRFAIHHYDVVIEMLTRECSADLKFKCIKESEKSKKILASDFNHRVFKAFVDTNSMFRGIFPVYDGQKNLFSSIELNIGKKEWRDILVLHNEQNEEERFAIKIKYATTINFDPKRLPEDEVLHTLERIFRYGPRFAKEPNICLRAFVFGPEYLTGKDLGKNMKLAYGYYANVRTTRSGLVINIDRAATVFYVGGPMLHIIQKTLNLRQLNRITENERKYLEKELKGLKFEVMHLPYRRKFTIHAITSKTASELSFKNQEESVDIKQYFESKYGSFLQKQKLAINPCLPCLKTTNGKYFPVEVCNLIPHQRRNGKLPENILAEMTRQSAMMKPADRFSCIQHSRNIVVHDGLEYLKQFGITVAETPMKITGRILPLPELLNKHGNSVVPVKPRSVGSWKMMPEQHFYLSAHLNRWVVVNFSNVQVKELKDFVVKLSIVAKMFGVKISAPSLPPLAATLSKMRGHLSEEIFIKAKEKVPELQMILFIIPKEAEVYEEIKHAGDVIHGIATQCVAEERFYPANKGTRKFGPLAFNDDYLFNLLQKINTRLGGINACLSPSSKPAELNGTTMIVGIDASHPTPGDKLTRSVAACVASMDKMYARYLVSVKAQEPFVNAKSDHGEKSKLVEEIVKLDEMMYTLLIKYREINQNLPERIIIFRDGVSDGQFDTVFRYEIVALKNSFAKFGAYDPKLTMIIVKKRHHTRFLPNRESGYNSELRSGNIMPGTCVDDFITSPVLFDYYICSHEGALGTSRPAHYCVLYDDSCMSADTFQKITYYLCYIYGRCLKPISIPAVVGYAHLASKKAREHLKSQKHSDQNLVTDQESIDTTRSMFSNSSYFI